MRLIFGIAADGRAYPATAARAGDLDAAVLGPAGLASLLETQLGLGGPVASRAVRTAAYLAKLRAAGDGRFWDPSFANDPWSTAAALLEWRDVLVSGGWCGTAVGSARVDDLAAAEASCEPTPQGLPDRLARLIGALPTRPGLRLEEIGLIEPRGLLPPQLAALMTALEAAGVRVQPTPPSLASADGSDLRSVQDALAGGARRALAGDGSFVLVEADTALMAAEAVADWLAAGPADAVILAPDGDTALLDRALTARGLPVLGLSRASPWRGAFQVLPLAFALAWRPFNPRALLNLLMLPRPPMARWAASKLSRAVAAEPGVGGAAWTHAWAEIEARLLEIHAEAGPEEARAKTDRTLADWRSWTDVGLFDRTSGISAEGVRDIAGRVAAWAVRTDSGAEDPLLLGVATSARALVDAVDRLELDVLPALLLERVLSQVLAEGLANPLHLAEAGALRAVRAPGALWSGAPRVIWWSFVGPGERPGLMQWDAAERRALASAGVTLEPAAQAAARIGAGYVQAVLQAAEQLLLVRPALSGEDQTTAHPLAHQLRPILQGAADGVHFQAERLLKEPGVTFARRTLNRAPVETTDPPVGVPTWSLSGDVAPRLATRAESATSLARLLNCQLGWFAQDVLGLRGGRFAELPRADQLFGNLAHEIARRLLPPGPPPPLAGVRRDASALFEQLLPQMAAALQQPEHAGELAAARELVPAALEALVRLLHERGLEVVGAELDRQGAHGGMPLHGRLDLLVRRGAEVAVLDLKWTRSDRRYVKEVAEGRAVQLAVYRAIVAGDGTAATGGYFLLRHRRIVAGAGSFLTDDTIETDRSDTETLDLVAQDWAAWRELTASGLLIAAGLPDAADHRPEVLGFPAPEKPCRYCGLTRLCRVQVEAV